ncbi:iron-sulfur cluster biosynthesis protein [Actinosynnema sp. NPDC050436]|uniref:iron-sulfur cluster biosynthesis protein n=1 Tax=Actinosynnema sp. NPDC050436 TaxID=3155659 RepID=UPI0033E06B5F
MLAVDDGASAAIRSLTRAADVVGEGGLRIAFTPSARGSGFELAIVRHPLAGEQVVDAGSGARVFLEHRAAEVLADKVLEARTDDDGNYRFGVYPQP